MEFNDDDEPIELGEPDELPMYNQAVNKVRLLNDEINKLRARVAELEAELARIKSNIDITEAATGMSGIYAKLESEIEHQRQLYAAHIGDEHDNCGVAVNQRLQAENERLRKIISSHLGPDNF